MCKQLNEELTLGSSRLIMVIAALYCRVWRLLPLSLLSSPLLLIIIITLQFSSYVALFVVGRLRLRVAVSLPFLVVIVMIR